MSAMYGTSVVSEVDPASFAAAHAAGAVVIDVREDWEYAAGHVPGARSIPLGRLPSALAGLPRTGPVYVICASGNRSQAGARLLAAGGFRSHSVIGGTGAWQRAGFPPAAGAGEL
jgi:rhodanese-related sulfurtransferase